MSVPNIETFEYDISNEIKTTDATISNIASASGTIENKEISSTKDRNFFLLIIFSIILIVISVVSILGYNFYLNTTTNTQNAIATTTINGTAGVLTKDFPIFDTNVGRFVSSTKKTNLGYDMTLNDYSNVFAYILRNEGTFLNEAVASLKIKITNATDTPQIINITESNQNMRALVYGSTTYMVYAFVNNNHLVVSPAVEGIIFMRNDIMK